MALEQEDDHYLNFVSTHLSKPAASINCISPPGTNLRLDQVVYCGPDLENKVHPETKQPEIYNKAQRRVVTDNKAIATMKREYDADAFDNNDQYTEVVTNYVRKELMDFDPVDGTLLGDRDAGARREGQTAD